MQSGCPRVTPREIAAERGHDEPHAREPRRAEGSRLASRPLQGAGTAKVPEFRRFMRGRLDRPTGSVSSGVAGLRRPRTGIALLRARQTDIESGPYLPMSVAVYELADGETAVEATEPFAPIISDAAWRRSAPELAALADKESAQLAKALRRIQHVQVWKIDD